jgi:hypothetical protein
VVGRRPVVGRPLLPVGSRLLKAAAGGDDFQRGNAIEIAHLLGERDPRHDRGLRVNDGRVGFQAAAVDAKHGRVPPSAHHVAAVDQPAGDFVDEHDRGDEVRDARALGFGDRKAGRDIVAGVAGEAADVGVVQVVVTEGDAVGEGRQFCRTAPRGPDHRRLAVRCKRKLAADAHRFLVERRDPAPDGVDHMRLGPLDGRGVDVLEAEAMGVISEAFGERAGGLRRRAGRDCRQYGRACCQLQDFATGNFHDVPLVRVHRAECVEWPASAGVSSAAAWSRRD